MQESHGYNAQHPTGPALNKQGLGIMMSQWWDNLIFLHWRVPAETIAPLLPSGVQPDIFDGSAWVGLIPFRMRGAGVSTGPSIPYFGDFLEMNVRTYGVDKFGRHGVYFLTLEADQAAVILGAQLAFGLPYRHATMSMQIRTPESDPSTVGQGTQRWRYTSKRKHSWLTRGMGGAAMDYSTIIDVEVGEEIAPDAQSPLDVFLSARYGLHVDHRGQQWWIANEHDPWVLRHATLRQLDDSLLAACGFGFLEGRAPDHIAASDGVFTRFAWPSGRNTAPRW